METVNQLSVMGDHSVVRHLMGDKGLMAAMPFFHRLEIVAFSESRQTSHTVCLSLRTLIQCTVFVVLGQEAIGQHGTASVSSLHGRLVKELILHQNFPNPFNPSTAISFSFPQQAHVQLQIFNLLGRLINTLVDEAKSSGTHTAARDASTRSSGLYFYGISAGKFVQTKKAVLIR